MKVRNKGKRKEGKEGGNKGEKEVKKETEEEGDGQAKELTEKRRNRHNPNNHRLNQNPDSNYGSEM